MSSIGDAFGSEPDGAWITPDGGESLPVQGSLIIDGLIYMPQLPVEYANMIREGTTWTNAPPRLR
jgi:hypothetical protein